MIVLLAACESVEPSGRVFSPVQAPPPAAAPAADPELAFPTAPPRTLSSEELREGTVAVATAAGVDAADLPEEPTPAPAPVAAPVAAPAPPSLPADPWPVRLLSTLPQAQPPRAVLGLPSGEEKVVSPGSMLAEQGLVVMAVDRKSVV